ncbi:MAG TPA: glycosyltransferase family 9 protein, partial [Mariprofundaceae bacterium]|nr:glycosyltransferase family 9 protein [Mariprofundaceae bacterium]
EVSEVHWLIDARYRFVSGLFPPQVVVHEVNLKGERPLISAWQTIRRLRRIGFDAVLDLQGLIKSAVLARLCGFPVYGIDTAELREKPAGWLQRAVRFHPEERHVVQQYRRVAAAPFGKHPGHPPGAPIDYVAPTVQKDVSEKLRDDSALTRLDLAGSRYVVLHSAGGWQTKQLPAETWLATARGIAERGMTAVFSWGNETERQRAAELAASGGLLLPERLNLSALAVLLSQATAVVGADTGVLHLAAALGSPTITFWGPSASWRSAPIGEGHWHIESNPACGPCFRRSCDHFTCMENIRASAILEALDELAG